MIPWSYSQWDVYKDCPARWYRQSHLKERGPQHPAAARGTDIHESISAYINGAETLHPEVSAYWQGQIDRLRDKGAESEQQRALTRLWQPAEWESSDAWGRFVIDARYDNTIIDFKTGRIRSSHSDQLAFYAAGMLAFDLPGTVTVEAWYLDTPETKMRQVLPPDARDMHRRIWERRGQILTERFSRDPIPGSHCRFCPFSNANGGDCEKG